jgi:hypothetical protein
MSEIALKSIPTQIKTAPRRQLASGYRLAAMPLFVTPNSL